MMRSSASPGVTGDRCLHLAALLASRICHDLAGSLGTVMNAVQLAQDAVACDREALNLAAEAAIASVHRLRLLRAAWGHDNEPLTVQQLKKLSPGFRHRRLNVHLDDIDPTTSFTADGARLVLNVMLLGVECLPFGGILALRGDASRELLVSICGPNAAWTPGFPTCLTSPAAAWAHLAQGDDTETSGLQCALTALIAHDSGLGISVLMAREAEAAPPLLLRLTRRDECPI